MILAEGREEGRQEAHQATIDLFRMLAETRFPRIQWEGELEAVQDLEGLRRLAHELSQIPDPETLRRRLVKLAETSA